MAKRRNRFQRTFIENNQDIIEDVSLIDIEEKEFPKKKRMKKKYKKEKLKFDDEFDDYISYIEE